ncbi:unnamed protein product [Brassica oleracea]
MISSVSDFFNQVRSSQTVHIFIDAKDLPRRIRRDQEHLAIEAIQILARYYFSYAKAS